MGFPPSLISILLLMCILLEKPPIESEAKILKLQKQGCYKINIKQWCRGEEAQGDSTPLLK